MYARTWLKLQVSELWLPFIRRYLPQIFFVLLIVLVSVEISVRFITDALYFALSEMWQSLVY